MKTYEEKIMEICGEPDKVPHPLGNEPIDKYLLKRVYVRKTKQEIESAEIPVVLQ